MVPPQDLSTAPDFALRLEQAEAAAWLDLEPALAGSRPIETQEIDGATVILDRSTDWPHSRIFNLGFQRPATAQTLERILDAIRAAGITTIATDVSPVARPGHVPRILTSAGFHYTDSNVVVARHTGEMPEPDSYFRLRIAAADDTDAAIQLMQQVMPAGPDWTVTLAGQIARPRWRIYLATENGVVCGLGGIHINEDFAWLSPSWVLPDHRNRGTQAALIAHAVRDAAASGIEWVTTSYPATVPGRTRNFERLGFSMVYQRRHFVWQAPPSQ